MIAEYDTIFDEKVERSALAIKSCLDGDIHRATAISRMVLLTAIRVEEENRNVQGEEQCPKES